jgi:glycosyltransferase involved in cell wall biosynthesis
MNIKNKPLVSVIITTKNNEKDIENCLKSINEQSYKNTEIIVVDNNSQDKTKKIASKYTSKVFNKGPERSSQRNFAVKKSSGDYVLYLDSDMILTRGVVEECINVILKNKDIFGIYIPEKIIGSGFWIKVREFERSFYDSTPIDCVRFIKRNIFLKVNGFDETLTGPEDWDFDKKIRKLGKTDLIKNFLYHNEGKFNFDKYLSKKAYYAKSFDRYISKWGKNDNDIKKQFGFYYRFFGVFLEKGKWKRFITHPILAFSMYTLRFLVGIKFLFRKKS